MRKRLPRLSVISAFLNLFERSNSGRRSDGEQQHVRYHMYRRLFIWVLCVLSIVAE